MKKISVILIALFAALSLGARTLYLVPGVWNTDGAKFAIYYFNGASDNGWSDFMTSVDADTYKADIPDAYTTVIFVRLNSAAAAPGWDAKWNQTEDLTVSGDYNQYSISDWGGDKSVGEWSVFGQQGGGGDNQGGSTQPQDYSSAVPSQCTDVMLQAFYWKSKSDMTYGGSQWATLSSQASEISSYFDIVWLPPSCNANDEMGYLPKEYHNQNSKMGMKAGLKNLIKALHAGGTKVVADVVINHCGNRSSWVDFMDMDFGTYGKFSPQSTWITSTDEAQGKGQLGSNADDGQESNANYPDARDWDHKNPQVQAMCRAYLKFLKGEMGYDGFRFDYCGGYHVSHINDYVSNAKPYFSVMEYWNGNPATLKARIDDASKNTLTFDFASFYTCYQQGIASNNYGKLVNPGLRGQGYAKYAVNFVDNHDTFNRADINNADCGNSKDGKSSLNNKELIMQCNAYLLSMPGIPCVFWPHWYRYKADIKKMITARKKAGVHSESNVSETSGNGYYEATVTGKYGQLILYLGSSANKAAPAGFIQAVKGSKYAIYYTGDGPQDIDNMQSQPPALDTRLPMYNVLGQPVDETYHGIIIQNGHKYYNNN